MILANEQDPVALAALAVSQWALGIAAVTFVLSLVALLWTMHEWRLSGAKVEVTASAWRSPTVQVVQASIRNHGRTPITINWVLLYGSGADRQPDREAPAMYLGSGRDEPLADVKPYRLEPQSSLELDAHIDSAAAFYGLPRFWVDVELATGKVRKSGWIKNQSSHF